MRIFHRLAAAALAAGLFLTLILTPAAKAVDTTALKGTVLDTKGLQATPRALWADLNGDGLQDLYVMTREQGDRLLLTSPSGLRDETAQAALPVTGTTLYAYALDLDGRPPLDLALVREGGRLVLLQNLGGHFLDISQDEAAMEQAVGQRVEVGGVTTTIGTQVIHAAVVRCADGLVDQRSPANCLETSSAPVQGKLYPMSQDLNVAFAPAALQTPALSFFGNGWPFQLGFAVDSAGDVNADGTGDIIVGVPGDDSTVTGNGRADVYSGLDGSLIYQFSGSVYQAYRGEAVSGAGDVNGDGIDDLLVGEPYLSSFAPAPGYVYVYSGQNGALLYSVAGLANGDEFGSAVDSLGDIDGDGKADFVVGAPVRPFPEGTGYAQVLSGANGTVLFQLTDGIFKGEFGTAVANAGDVNGDGKNDIVVGAPAALAGFGRVTVFSGANGAVLYTFDGDAAPDYLGFSVDGAGDVNGDGFSDIIAGAPFGSTGFARVYSGKDGTVLYTFNGAASGDYMGRAVAGVGDLSGDGKGDLLVGSPQPFSGGNGQAFLFSGADGSVLWQVVGQQQGDILGLELGHGETTLLISSPNENTGAQLGGAVRAYRTQYVGIGTTAPDERLTVAGIVASEQGGFVFPNGTVQTAANTPGPPGSQGPPGVKGPKGPQGPPGGGVQAINGLANKPLAIAGSGGLTTSAAGSTVTIRSAPTLCVEGSKSYSEGAVCYVNITNCTSGIGFRGTKKTCLASGSWQNSTSSQCFNPSPSPICGQ